LIQADFFNCKTWAKNRRGPEAPPAALLYFTDPSETTAMAELPFGP
jgi:hypothetical protein